MGFVVSMPLQMAGTWAASCCGSVCFSLVANSCKGIGSSFSTRLSYALLLLFNSMLSWVMLTDWAMRKLSLVTRWHCEGVECGFFAVYKVNFALALFHLLLGALLLGVHSTANPRARLQNGLWSAKILCYLGLLLASFMIPDGFYVWFSRYVSVACGFLFLVMGLILLVDFAHEWAEKCIEHVENEDEHSQAWKTMLISGTAIMYLGSVVMTVLMYVFFCSSGCSMNQAAVSINLVLSIAITAMSISPKVQEYNPNCGLAQSAMVSVYCTYLTISACSSEPDDRLCNPLVRSRGTRTASIVLGAIFTFIAIAYTTTRAAANSAFTTGGSIKISGDESGYADNEASIVTKQPSARNEMRMQAIREAVAVGTLPESALHDQSWLYDDDSDADEERVATKYNYSLFHLIFFLATQWIAVLLTMNVQQDDFGDFVPVGRTYFYSWVKIVSAWVCYGIYGWSLVAPMLFPDRFGYDV